MHVEGGRFTILPEMLSRLATRVDARGGEVIHRPHFGGSVRKDTLLHTKPPGQEDIGIAMFNLARLAHTALLCVGNGELHELLTIYIFSPLRKHGFILLPRAPPQVVSRLGFGKLLRPSIARELKYAEQRRAKTKELDAGLIMETGGLCQSNEQWAIDAMGDLLYLVVASIKPPCSLACRQSRKG